MQSCNDRKDRWDQFVGEEYLVEVDSKQDRDNADGQRKAHWGIFCYGTVVLWLRVIQFKSNHRFQLMVNFSDSVRLGVSIPS